MPRSEGRARTRYARERPRLGVQHRRYRKAEDESGSAHARKPLNDGRGGRERLDLCARAEERRRQDEQRGVHDDRRQVVHIRHREQDAHVKGRPACAKQHEERLVRPLWQQSRRRKERERGHLKEQ